MPSISVGKQVRATPTGQVSSIPRIVPVLHSPATIASTFVVKSQVENGMKPLSRANETPADFLTRETTLMLRVTLAWIAFSLLMTAVADAQAPADSLPGFPQISATNDWPWWRGPTRDGHAARGAMPPTKFSDTENVVWKMPLPGRGHSSPVVVGSRVFLTTADEATKSLSVVALDRATGRQLWQTPVAQGGFARIHGNNTHATPTIACDGERAIAVFHHHDQLQVVALDFDGKIVWDKSLGEFHPRRYEYGYGPSPVVYGDTVIITAEYDGDSHISALDRRTGNVVWRTPRPNNMTYSSPSINVIDAGADSGTDAKLELMTITGADKLWCFDPRTGKSLWTVAGTTAATCGTTVSDRGIIFASGGYPKSETIAVHAGDRKLLWKKPQQCYEQSMLATGGYLFALTDNGVLFCFRGSDGAEMWKQRLRGKPSASPVLAGGNIYWANERGTHYVFKATGDKFELIAENTLGDESFASPAVAGDRLYLRVAQRTGDVRQEYLYCIGVK
jgi:outer membrane protein assembly factor BamB